MTHSLFAYRRMEARRALGAALPVGLLAGLATLALSSAVLPRLPAGTREFLEQGTLLRGTAEVVLLNDLLAVYAFVFFAGAARLLQAIVQPREERGLEILLAKPVPLFELLRARTLPVLLAAAALGAALALGCGLAATLHADGVGRVTPLGVTCAGLVVTAIAVALLAACQAAWLFCSDAFQALCVGVLVWMAPLLPLTALIYRPDVLARAPALRDVIALPANLIWHDGAMPALAVAALCACGLGSWAALRLSGALAARMELRPRA